MKGKIYFLIAFSIGCLSNTAQAICVENQTDFKLYYEIHNKNTGCNSPKVKFHDGFLSSNQKNCHDHSPKDGEDWKIYRKDLIKVYKIDSTSNQRQLVCNKMVEGILNTLQVSFLSSPDSWWCLDRSDSQD